MRGLAAAVVCLAGMALAVPTAHAQTGVPAADSTSNTVRCWGFTNAFADTTGQAVSASFHYCAQTSSPHGATANSELKVSNSFGHSYARVSSDGANGAMFQGSAAGYPVIADATGSGYAQIGSARVGAPGG